MERPAMPANELEGLIRDRLPDAVRRHLRDVQIDRIDRDDSKPNWIGMPIWETDPSDDDKRKFPCDHASASQEIRFTGH